MVYADDHNPPHVHVKKDGYELRIFLKDMSSTVKHGAPTEAEKRGARVVVLEHKPECWKGWRERNL